MRVLDLGGAPPHWTSAPEGVRPKHVTTLNLAAFTAEEPWIEHVIGDACHPPTHIMGEQFDLVFSNSLLEHVGGHARREAFADVVHALADHHWVQTPYRYFPIEPHWLFPGMQFLPFRARRALSLRWPYGHIQTDTIEAAHERVSEVELIDATQMRGYFPRSTIWRERFLGITKSLVAVRQPRPTTTPTR